MKRLTCLLLLAAALPAQKQPPPWDVLAGNTLSPWHVIGPFGAEPGKGLDVKFLDEGVPDLSREHRDAGGAKRAWSKPARPLPDGEVVDLAPFGAGDDDTMYLFRTITAIADHEAILSMSMDDSAALWVNGEEVFREDRSQAVSPDQYRVKAKLRKGANAILLKVTNKKGYTGFWFELSDDLGAGDRWGAGVPGDGFDHYEIAKVPVPDDVRLEVGGLLFLPDRSLLVCCRRGQIYRIHDPAESDPARLRVSLFAEGLHEPLGMLREDDGSILVAQKPELTRLRDTDGDGHADEFETVVADWGLSGNYHEYTFGPVRDGNGDLWCTLNIGFPSGSGPARTYRGSAFRVTPSGRFAITCMGLRSPNGLMVNDAGDVFYTDNQGEWMDVCRLTHLQPHKNYGHPVSFEWAHKMPEFGWETERTLPAIWYPYHLARSVSWPVVDRTGGKFGPYAGQTIVGDQNNSLLVRTTLEKVGGVYQGACYPFWQGFAGGINRLAFDADGILYVGLTNRGWGSVGSTGHGLYRMTWRGKKLFDLLEAKVTPDGWDLCFTKPLAPDTDLDVRRFFVREYGYKYFSRYGSPEYDSRRVPVEGAALSADGNCISLRVGSRNLHKVFEISIRAPLLSADGERPFTQQAFYTLHAIPTR